ncbi:hypothetical protein [Nocardiopsis sp. TNDT3]|uniref:hypothetical protein n=1 Tax=Nocardiopsis sp. TNDT3 TaxID=2249354 RepID=UPI000E3CAFC1|nr:hypothetical protein [Nocardiopsis sp. TNDT3]
MPTNADAHPGPRPTAPDAQGGSRRRAGWPEIIVGTVVTLVLYAVGTLLFLQIPAEGREFGGLAQYAISGLAPLGGFAAVHGPHGLRTRLAPGPGTRTRGSGRCRDGSGPPPVCARHER